MPSFGALANLPKQIRNSSIKGKNLPSPEVEATLKRQGLSVDDWLLDQEAWTGGAETPAQGVFAPDEVTEPAAGGALAGIKPTKKGGDFFDYIGLAGATLGQMGGQQGLINDYMDRYSARGQQAAMDELLGSIEDLSPEEQAQIAAGDGKGVLASRADDKRWDKRYDKTRADTVSDMTTTRGYQVEDRDTGYKHADASREDTQASEMDRFLQTMGFERDQFGEVKRHNLATEQAARTGSDRDTWSNVAPDLLQKAGYPEGTVAQVNDRTGKIDVQVKPNVQSGIKPTESERKFGLYAANAVQALKDLDSIEYAGGWNDGQGEETFDRGGQYNPMDGTGRKYDNALDRFLDSWARAMTGAAMTIPEKDYYYGMLKPQFGDAVDLRRQKASMRHDMVKQLETAAASGAQPGFSSESVGGGGPSVGTVEDGFRFKGGNPSDPNSWEPAQ